MLCRKLFQSSFFFFFVISFLISASFQFFNCLASSCISFLMKMVFHLQFSTQNILSRWAWSVHWISSKNCSLWDSAKKSLLELFVEDVLRDLIHQNRIFCDSSELDFLWLFRVRFRVRLKRITPFSVPSTFLWHRYPATVSRLHAFLWDTCETEDSNTVRTPNCLVLSFVVFEK